MKKEVSEPDEKLLDDLDELLEKALYLSAWAQVNQAGQAAASLETWTGCRGRDLAARLAGGLGNLRLRDTLHLINARKHPGDDNAFLYGAFRNLSRRGPMEVLERIDARLAARGAMNESVRADLLALKGWSHARLRDFEPAHRASDEAMSILPDRAWLHVQRSSVLEFEDRYEEALETARSAWRLAPGKPAAVLQLVDCLIHLGLDDEAIALLERSHQEGQTALFAQRLVSLFSEREDHRKALHFLDEHDRRSPLLDKPGREWSDRRRADFLYLAGDFEGALACCDRVPEGYHTRIAKTMRLPGALGKERKRLDVPFVRQHNVTCAPATLAALAAYWGLEIDHLAIADAICYDGTPDHKERLWAESNGFHTVEFRLTHEIAVALIDRGLPFTLTTEAVTSSHLQACIGYDNRQGTLLLRDPTERHFGEIILEGLIEDHPGRGPRCMLLIPRAEIGRIAGLNFPDNVFYEAQHQLSLAIERHDREAARAAVAATPPGEPLTIWGELRLATYDRNPAAQLRALDALVDRFPDNAPLRYMRFGALQRAAHDNARERQLLRDELQRKDCDPVFYSEMGELLLRDARQLPLADYYLRKAVRMRSGTAQVYSSLAYCRWKERRFEDSARYRRAASCLGETFEPYAASYAEVCRAVGRPGEGVAFLRRRVEALGNKSGGPWQTLAEELEAQRRTQEAIAVLDRGMAARPDDGQLMLSSGRLLALWGERERGETLLVCARGKVREGEWRRGMAGICGFLGRRKEAIAHWQALLALEPYSADGHRAIARLLADEQGQRKAMEHLIEATTADPALPWLWSLRAEWEQHHSPTEAIASLERARALDPDSPWVIRELALQRLRAGDRPGGLAAARDAVGKDPHSPASHAILAQILTALGPREEARDSYRTAIRLDVDYTSASTELIALAPDPQATLEALRFIESEMRRQVSDGSIVTEYRDLAYQHLEPKTLLAQLREFCEERPDLWQTWAARREQAEVMELFEEAFQCARALTERFPLLPRAWVELAQAHHAVGGYGEEIEALERAVNLSPAWDWAARQLAEALERMERYDEALEVLERALQHEPLVAANHGCLADLLWKLGRREEAFERLLAGMRDCPGYGWGWSALCEWAVELKRQEEVAALVESHRAGCSHLVSWWTKASGVLDDLGRTEAALAAIDAGLERHPEEVDLIDERARLLVALNRFDDASAACLAGLAAHSGSLTLNGRQAWVLMAAGRPNEAIRQMTALIAARPDYLWGIRQLAGWLSERERWTELRDLCRKWVRQEPQFSRAHGFLGQAEKNLSNSAAARAAFEKAFALEPEYAYAGRQLISCLIEDGELEAAEQTLRTLEHYASSAMITADAVELAVAKKDRAEAGRRAAELLARSDATAVLLDWMKELFAKNRWTADWWKLLDARAKSAEPTKPALEAWIRSLPGRSRIAKAARRLAALSADQENLKAHGWVTLLEIADRKKDAARIRRWVRKNRDWFQSRNDLWAAAGSALTKIHDHHAAIRWFRDWESRGEQVPCTALFDHAVAVESVEGWQKAAPLREEALRRFPSHRLSPALRATVALQASLGSDPETARALGAEVESDSLSEFYGGYFALHQSLVAAGDGRLETAEARYRSALDTFNKFDRERGVASVFQSVEERLAQFVPWAGGKPSKIRRKWGRYTGASAFGQLAWWQIVLLTFIVLRVIRAFLGD